jgi:hypothetical protein
MIWFKLLFLFCPYIVICFNFELDQCGNRKVPLANCCEIFSMMVHWFFQFGVAC